jgi:5-methylcytosine-specific restriction enzyme subunit McrC
MEKLFEQFVRNFYSKEQSTYRVSASHVRWDVNLADSTAEGIKLLPSMKTDICMESQTDKLIVDCKFYKDAFQYSYDTKKFMSAHIYQLFSYLRNQAAKDGWQSARGMLLYPTVGEVFDETVSLQGHRVRFASINLGQPWQGIATDLLSIVTP